MGVSPANDDYAKFQTLPDSPRKMTEDPVNKVAHIFNVETPSVPVQVVSSSKKIQPASVPAVHLSLKNLPQSHVSQQQPQQTKMVI